MDHQQQPKQGAGPSGRDAQSQKDKWHQAFLKIAAAAGIQVQPGVDPHPDTVLKAVLELKQAGQRVQELQQQEAALAVQVSHLTLQNLELRRELNSGWMLAEPNILQVRQLLLDPAVQQEFVKLRRELEDHKSIIQQLKEQNDSLTFTAESKIGRQLIKKTKLLADENQEMAMQLREGPAATRRTLLDVERHHVNELRKGISQIKDHCTYLEEENEELNMLRFLNERQIHDLGVAAPAEPRRTAFEGDRGRAGLRGPDRTAAVGAADRERDRHAGGRDYSMSSRGGGRGDMFGRSSSRGRGRGDGGGRFAGHKRLR